jgi:hypothetical protein
MLLPMWQNLLTPSAVDSPVGKGYLRSLITRIASHPAKRIDELPPWNIKL